MSRKLKSRARAASDESELRADEEVKKLGKEAIDLFSEHVHKLTSGRELDDLIRYDGAEALKSVLDRLEAIAACGVFKSKPAPFDQTARIWRHDIRALSQDEKKLFVSFMLGRMLENAVRKGPSPEPRDIVFLDEAHLYLDDDPENPACACAKEGRKFGLCLICASQAPGHFPEDFASNCATKIVLGLDEMHWDGAKRRMGLERAALEWIIPRRRFVVQMGNVGEARSRYHWTYAPGAVKQEQAA